MEEFANLKYAIDNLTDYPLPRFALWELVYLLDIHENRYAEIAQKIGGDLSVGRRERLTAFVREVMENRLEMKGLTENKIRNFFAELPLKHTSDASRMDAMMELVEPLEIIAREMDNNDINELIAAGLAKTLEGIMAGEEKEILTDLIKGLPNLSRLLNMSSSPGTREGSFERYGDMRTFAEGKNGEAVSPRRWRTMPRSGALWRACTRVTLAPG